MSDLEINGIVPRGDRPFPPEPRASAAHDSKQRKLMLGSLCLLLLALSIALWHERDFWFPDSSDADSDQPAETVTTTITASQPASVTPTKTAVAKPKHAVPAAKASTPPPAPPPVTASRTVLPPLEVEVVAGDNHRTVRPGNNSVRLDLRPGTPPQPVTDSANDTQTAASVTSNAAEHVQMSADASEIVAKPVRPNYPLLARQMKVQGSVILQALIGKDGIIQNLHVISGPQILASAAEDAVRQWHFRPHLQGTEPVETQAKITVNFTISTN